MIKLVLPKGRLFDETKQLLEDAGFKLRGYDRSYRPAINDAEIEVKMMKPQNIAKLVELGSHDIGITGKDWIVENKADVEELLDLGFGRVSIVAAIPVTDFVMGVDSFKGRRLVVTSEYKNLSEAYLKSKGINYEFLLSYGATEVFPPEDADMIIENMDTGETLKQNNLMVVDTLMQSSARLIANKKSLQDSTKAKKIKQVVLLLESVLNARKRVLVEVNAREENLERVVGCIPFVKTPTMSKSLSGEGYVIRAVVERSKVRDLIPTLVEAGATDINEIDLNKVINVNPTSLKARQHTAEHVFYRVLLNKYKVRPRNVQFSEDKVRIDVLCETDLRGVDLKSLEQETNDVIKQGLEVKKFFVTRDEAAKLVDTLELLPDNVDKIRIVQVGEFDRQACIGEHVDNTREIGEFKLLGVERKGKDTYRFYSAVQ